jgi:hypothetical protein
VNKLKVFISSVQNEFAKERQALYKHFRTDALVSTGGGEIFRLTKEADLIEPIIELEEGFKVTLWRPSAQRLHLPDKQRTSSDQATEHVTEHFSGEATGEANEYVIVGGNFKGAAN